jgi:hypothetical protein
MPSHFLHSVRQHLNQTLWEQRIGRGGPLNWPAQSPDINLLDFWLWRRLKTLVNSVPINDLRGIRPTRRQCLLENSSETRNFRQSTHLCATRSWKLCWNAWEPHRASDVEITWTSAISQQTLISGRRDIFIHLSEYYTPFNPRNLLLTTCISLLLIKISTSSQ